MRTQPLQQAPEATPELPPTYSRRNARGLIEVLDAHTGRVLCVQMSEMNLFESKMNRLTRIDTPQGPVWIEKGLNFDLVSQIKAIPYSKVLADLICQEVVKGRGLIRAAQMFNLDYADICRWKREHEEFRNALSEARKDRAEAFHDQALETAEDSRNPKLRVDTLVWAAERGDPEKFGSKTKIVGDPDAPIQFIIGTGIQRPGDPGYQPPKQEELPPTEIKQVEEIADWEPKIE